MLSEISAGLQVVTFEEGAHAGVWGERAGVLAVG
jgi:hypothetical protein